MTLDVLVVEDNTAMQKLYERAFKKPNVNAVIKGSLEEAVSEAKGKKFDLYITGKDAFYKKIKEIAPEANVHLFYANTYKIRYGKTSYELNLFRFFFDMDKVLESAGVADG